MAWNNPWMQPPGYQQPYGGQQPQPNPYRPQQTNMDWIRVPNIGDIDQVTVQPGQTAWVMAQNTNVFAVRSADQMGITNTRYFQFAEFDPRAADQQKQTNIEQQQANFEQRLRRLEAIFDGTEPIE